jgi:hypothetical protein
MKINQPKISNDLKERTFADVLNDEYKELHSAIVKNAEFTNERFYDMQLNQTIIKIVIFPIQI